MDHLPKTVNNHEDYHKSVTGGNFRSGCEGQKSDWPVQTAGLVDLENCKTLPSVDKIMPTIMRLAQSTIVGLKDLSHLYIDAIFPF